MPFAITELKSLFHEQGHPRSYRKGHIICSQGDTFSTVYMVTSGMVKNYDLDENGSERTISIFGRDNPFPILWLLADPPDRHLYY
ncbi:MAG TPA: cyclic nucleotide-binding domain-containing protein, partial [Candidatus Saccharimonadia bacterium]|nr:cyclic nucleotide-binding domain-containing protein [Candidatus Saccharimonadia bacterium]